MKMVSKGTNKRLEVGLTTNELACKCNYEFCTVTIVHPDLIKAWGKFRRLVKVPIRITSGFRCAAHNKDHNGSNLSRHMTGQAVDISRKSLDHLSDSDIEFAAKESGFTYIKFYKTWVHLDVRK